MEGRRTDDELMGGGEDGPAEDHEHHRERHVQREEPHVRDDPVRAVLQPLQLHHQPDPLLPLVDQLGEVHRQEHLQQPHV